MKKAFRRALIRRREQLKMSFGFARKNFTMILSLIIEAKIILISLLILNLGWNYLH
jgi:hypothetical protein